MRKVDGKTAGLKARELTLSSGGDTTSKSFIGLKLVVFALPNTPVLPKLDVVFPPNKLILGEFQILKQEISYILDEQFLSHR